MHEYFYLKKIISWSVQYQIKSIFKGIGIFVSKAFFATTLANFDASYISCYVLILLGTSLKAWYKNTSHIVWSLNYQNCKLKKTYIHFH